MTRALTKKEWREIWEKFYIDWNVMFLSCLPMTESESKSFIEKLVNTAMKKRGKK